MNPAPSREHQEIEKRLLVWLEINWARPLGNRVYHQINLAAPGGWPGDFRIPDLLLLLPERFGIEREQHFAGPPNVVVEIRSPGDETDDKLEFYATLGVDELWIVDRDSRAIELHCLCQGKYQPATASSEGWLRSQQTSVELRQTESQLLEIRLQNDDESCESMP